LNAKNHIQMNGTVNKVILIGHLGDEVKTHYFEGGNAIGRFPLATNETYKNKEGNQVNIAEWHNIVVRNKLAELCEKYLTKGDKVYVEGRIKTRQWTDDSGATRYMTEIYVNDLTFLSNKKALHKGSQNEEGDVKPKQVNIKKDKDGKYDLPF